MQCVRQAIFYRASLAAPMTFVGNPAGTLRDIGPGANIGETPGQGVDVARGFVDPADLRRQPVIGDMAGVLEKAEDALQKVRVFLRRDALKVGDAADVPQEPQVLRRPRPVSDRGQVGQHLQAAQIIRLAPAHQPFIPGRRFKRSDQPVERAEIKRGGPPVEALDRAEAVILDGADNLIGQGAGLTRHAEGAGRHVPPCPARDLRQFMREQLPHPPAVEFRRRGEGDMVDVEVQPHADGIGRHKVIDIAVLIHRHLGVAGAGGQRAHHHRSTALLAADQFGHRIDIFNRKPNDRRPRGHPA